MSDPQQKTTTCYKCGADITGSPDWCSACGAVQTTTCHHCGTVYRKSEGRCPSCGTIRIRKRRSRRERISLWQKVSTFASRNRRVLGWAAVGAVAGAVGPKLLMLLAAKSMPPGWLNAYDYRHFKPSDVPLILGAAGRTVGRALADVGAWVLDRLRYYRASLMSAAFGAILAVGIYVLHARISAARKGRRSTR
ncbi:MAG: hypothetical protein ACUVTZ_08590 [Armatimonadota bacterium]